MESLWRRVEGNVPRSANEAACLVAGSNMVWVSRRRQTRRECDQVEENGSGL